MKILWHSVKPTISTGYGTQTALWTQALVREGHEVAISCSAGLYNNTEVWKGIKMFPHSSHPSNYGSDTVGDHFKYLGMDMVWSWLDAFVIWPAECKKVPWAAWVPVDSEPLMSLNLPPLRGCRWTVGPTRFAQRVLREAKLIDPLYLPCAFDSSVMYRRAYRREEIKRAFSDVVRKDVTGVFLVSAVSANSGDRKNFPAMFEAWKIFRSKCPRSILYLHTEVTGKWAEGKDLEELVKLYEIDPESILVVNQWHYNTGQIGDDYLNLMYNACDVHLNTCVGEGFGLPIMDAQACGCPTIVPDFAAAGEIGFGIKISKGARRPLVPGAFQFLVDPEAVAEALAVAYERRGDDKWREEMIERSEPYELTNVMEQCMKPVLEKIQGELKQ